MFEKVVYQLDERIAVKVSNRKCKIEFNELKYEG